MLYSTSIGLDVHARSIKAAAFIPETGEVREASFDYEPDALIEWARKLPPPVRCVYESGPSGFDLLRRLRAGGIWCVVGAVSKMLRPSGDKIKTDKRDAIFLARMLAVGNVVEVYVPSEEDEAARDLVRAREDARHDLSRAKHLLTTLLLRKGIVYNEGKTAWTKTYRKWLEKIKFPTHTEMLVFSEYLMAIDEAERRRDRLDAAILTLSRTERWKDLISRLCLLRGISLTTAFTVAAEIGDFTRFKNASAFYSYLGLIPSLNESGESSSRGPITKTGNTHVRQILIETAWNHKRRYVTSKQLSSAEVSPELLQLAKKANLRLHDRAIYLSNRRLHPCKVNVAVAREAAGFIWAFANLTDFG